MVKRWWPEDIKARNGADIACRYVQETDFDTLQDNALREVAALAARLAEAEQWAKRASAACHGVINLPELYVALSEIRRVTADSADGGHS